MAILERLRRAWDVFVGQPLYQPVGTSGNYRDSRTSGRLRIGNDKSIVTAVYTKIAMDVAGVLIKHVELDDKKRYKGDVDSDLNLCLTLQPNLDQGPRAFRQDICMTLFDSGTAALVPVKSERDPLGITITDVSDIRVGDITEFLARSIRVNVWNEDKGRREEIVLEKRHVPIVDNPLSPVMNEPNSTMKRLVRKLGLLDTVDEASSSGKLDLIIQLPYAIKSPARRQQAEERREAIEFQLAGSKYGIAYADATEKITQLNRPAENQLLKQVEYLVDMLYTQLGITPEVMNGTADEATMVNYYARTVYPIVDAIVQAIRRTWLGKAGIARGEDIRYFREPFKFVPLSNVAEIADKFIRNKVMTPNEIRDGIGLPPSDDPEADKLVNPNMPEPDNSVSKPLPVPPRRPKIQTVERNSQNGT